MKTEQYSEYLAISNETRTKIPNIPWVNIKDTILGKKYELSLVFPNKKNALS